MSKRVAGFLMLVVLVTSACSCGPPATPTEVFTPPTEEAATAAPIPNNTPEFIPTQPLSPTSLPLPEAPIQETPANPAIPATHPLLTNTSRYRLQAGSPVGVANFVAPESGCNWLGIGGQAFDLNGTPVTNLVVEIGGTLEGTDVFHLSLTGSSTLIGPGGFIIVLANHVVASNGTLWILLYDLAGQPLTDKIPFVTYADCTGNFILINFIENPANFQPRARLPLIVK